jgi:2,3-bisphosphoglycerate-dependent phosphoglycerate mutase
MLESKKARERNVGVGIERLILVRHGVSTANLDPRIYLQVSDHRIPLVDPQNDSGAVHAGVAIKALGIRAEEVCVWTSPYVRCMQTLEIVTRTAFEESSSKVLRRESFLLREQEFGDWDGLSEEVIAERYPVLFEKRKKLADEYGRFYFRYPNGESRADVVQRVTLFLGKVQRSSHPTHLIFLHGVTQRAFRMAWMNHPVDWLEREPNPKNASVHIIERVPAPSGGSGSGSGSGSGMGGGASWTERTL